MADTPPAPGRKPESPGEPERKLDDSEVAPWQMPTPEEKAEAEPVRGALKKALEEVDSQEKADAVAENIAEDAAGLTAEDVAAAEPPAETPAEAARRVEKAAERAPDEVTPEVAIEETARVLAAADAQTRAAVSEVAQEVFNPEQEGAPVVEDERQREYLRRAVLKRLRPLDALDAQLFLAINHLPHTRLLNGFFYTLTLIFTGGAAWYALMGAVSLRSPRLSWRMAREAVIPLALATSLVEYPIKRYFRRRRPFIAIIQAIVIGRKPGSWSFPSGHSATAFAGAWLFGHYIRRLRWLWYTIAGLVAFSRIYLGNHYPGDVVSGSTLGALFAMILHRLFRFMRRGWRK